MRKIKTVSDMQDLKLYFLTPFLRKLLEDELHQDKKDAKSRKPEMPHWKRAGGKFQGLQMCAPDPGEPREGPASQRTSQRVLYKKKPTARPLELNDLQQKVDSCDGLKILSKVSDEYM